MLTTEPNGAWANIIARPRQSQQGSVPPAGAGGLFGSLMIRRRGATTTKRRIEINIDRPPTSDFPDLVVTKVEAPNLDGGDVMVTVKNQGTVKANACYLALTLPVGSTAAKTRTMAQPALNPGESVTIAFVIGGGLSQVKYCATTDRSNTVRESNERNNRNCGQFGGKP